MRISLLNRFVFLSNPRCGSTSVRRVVSPFSEFRSTDRLVDLPHHRAYRTVAAWMRERGLRPEEFKAFTTVRNPWSRMVSIYEYAKSEPRSAWNRAMGSGYFHDFVKSPFVRSQIQGGGDDNGQAPYLIRDFAGGVARAFPIEEPDALRAFLCEVLGREIELPMINRTGRVDYAEYYSAESRDVVAELFKSDIEMFGYEFRAPVLMAAE